jgi:hypothetical protein
VLRGGPFDNQQIPPNSAAALKVKFLRKVQKRKRPQNGPNSKH